MKRLDDRAPAALLGLRVPRPMLKALKARARKGESVSEVVRAIIADALAIESESPQDLLRRIERDAKTVRQAIEGKTR